MNKLIVTEQAAFKMHWKEGEIINNVEGGPAIVHIMPNIDPCEDQILTDKEVEEIIKNNTMELVVDPKKIFKLPPFRTTIDGVFRGLIELDPDRWPFKLREINNMELEHTPCCLGELEIETIKYRQKINERRQASIARCHYGYI